MDSYLSMAGLALAIAALVPILFSPTRIKFWTVTAAALSLVILIGTFQAYKQFSESRAVKESKEEVWSLLTKNEKGMTFDQIYDNMYYPNFAIANAAIDELVGEGRILTEKIDTKSTDGTQFVVRKFYRRFD